MQPGVSQELLPAIPDPLGGGGELGALMRAKDWSQTPLGPVESLAAGAPYLGSDHAHLAPAHVRVVGRRADQFI